MNKANPEKLAYIGSKPSAATRDSDSWFTPKAYIESARIALGGKIDLDPFSSPEAQKVVRAIQYFTKKDDALAESTVWPSVDSVFMNPPYSRGIASAAIGKFLGCLDAGYIRRGIILMNNATDTLWFYQAWGNPYFAAFCFTKGRIAFENVDGKRVSGNTRGQVILFFTRRKGQGKRDDVKAFKKAFAALGNLGTPG
jgi:phage N-6-adenine-methyltransferase